MVKNRPQATRQEQRKFQGKTHYTTDVNTIGIRFISIQSIRLRATKIRSTLICCLDITRKPIVFTVKRTDVDLAVFVFVWTIVKTHAATACIKGVRIIARTTSHTLCNVKKITGPGRVHYIDSELYLYVYIYKD